MYKRILYYEPSASKNSPRLGVTNYINVLEHIEELFKSFSFDYSKGSITAKAGPASPYRESKDGTESSRLPWVTINFFFLACGNRILHR